MSETNAGLGDFDLGFTGKWLDRATGLQWNLNRWYNPSIQRWMSEDPIGFAGGDGNLGRYVANSATQLVDPSGLAWWNLWLADLGASFGDFVGTAYGNFKYYDDTTPRKTAAERIEEISVIKNANCDTADVQSYSRAHNADANATGVMVVGATIAINHLGSGGNYVAPSGGVGVGGRPPSGGGSRPPGGGGSRPPRPSTSLVPVGAKPLGEWGEIQLAQVLGNQGVKPSGAYATSLGKRYIDRLLNGVAHEAKAGLNVCLTSAIRKQISKDVELTKMGRIAGAHWHFFQGAQQELLDFLTASGIQYTVH